MKTLTVSSDNIIGRYAWLVEQRIQRIEAKNDILEHPEKYKNQFDFDKVSDSLKIDAILLDGLLEELSEGRYSEVLGPEIQKFREKYSTPFLEEGDDKRAS